MEKNINNNEELVNEINSEVKETISNSEELTIKKEVLNDLFNQKEYYDNRLKKAMKEYEQDDVGIEDLYETDLEKVYLTFAPLLHISRLVFDGNRNLYENEPKEKNLTKGCLKMKKQISDRITVLLDRFTELTPYTLTLFDTIDAVSKFFDIDAYANFTDNVRLNEVLESNKIEDDKKIKLSDILWLEFIQNESGNNFFLNIMEGFKQNDVVYTEIPGSEGLAMYILPVYCEENDNIKYLILLDTAEEFLKYTNGNIFSLDIITNGLNLANAEFMYKAEYTEVLDAIAHFISLIVIIEDYKEKMRQLEYSSIKEELNDDYSLEEFKKETDKINITLSNDMIVSFNDYINTILS